MGFFTKAAGNNVNKIDSRNPENFYRRFFGFLLDYEGWEEDFADESSKRLAVTRVGMIR